VTVNDVVLAMCSGALRSYLLAMDALPDAPLVAMVPIALPAAAGGDGGGNALGLVMCNLGSDQPDPALRLHTVLRSMTEGKQALRSMSRLQIIAVSALGIAPAGLYALLGVSGLVRPPFNLVISNLPGSAAPLYWNGARLDGLYPLSIPMDGLALNITCTSYYDQLAFGLTGCRRTVPHLQRLLGYLEDELVALEHVAGMAAGC
jgi:diacylglycerol O-acyltransferase